MRNSLFLAALLALVVLAPVGAQAGQPVNQTFMCRPGSFLVGMQGRAGNWLDQFQPVCQPWNPALHRLDAVYLGDTFGNLNGGSPTLLRAPCAPGATMFEVDYNVVSPNGPPGHVQGVSVRCANLPYFDGVREVALDGPPGGQGNQSFCKDKAGQFVNGETANGLLIGLDGINIASLSVLCDTPANIEAAAPSPIRARFNARAIRSVP